MSNSRKSLNYLLKRVYDESYNQKNTHNSKTQVFSLRFDTKYFC